VLRGRQAALDLLAFLAKVRPKFSGEFTLVDSGFPRPSVYRTPDGAVHSYWGR